MQLVLLIGLPGAGKTTFFRERFAETHAHVSKDNFPNHRRPAKRQRFLLDEALGQGHDVVLDNTNASPEERAAAIALARDHDAEIVGYFFDLTPTESIERNESRPASDRVPQVGIYATAKRLRLPQLEEGFHRLYTVHACDGEFHVTEISSHNRPEE